MADPQRRRVTLTLTLTEDELATIGGDSVDDIVIDRIGTLAVLAVIPPPARTPRRVALDALIRKCGVWSVPPPDDGSTSCGTKPAHASVLPCTTVARLDGGPARTALITQGTRT